MPSSRALNLAALAGTGLFLGCLLALHALTIQHIPWYMSEYANGPYRALYWAAGYAFTLAIVSLGLCLRRVLPSSRASRVAVVLVLLVAPFAALATTFPVDEGDAPTTMQGQVHDWSTIPMFLFMTAAMLLLVPAFKANPAWRAIAPWTLGLGLAAALAEFAYLAGRLMDQPVVGVAQRLLVGVIVGWFAVTAFHLRRLAIASPTSSLPTPDPAPVDR